LTTKTSAIILAHADEIEPTLLYAPWLKFENEWICLTIDAYDRCLSIGIINAVVPQWIQEFQTYSDSQFKKIKDVVHRVEEEYITVRRQYGIPSATHWNYQHNEILLTALDAERQIARLATKYLIKEKHYLIPKRPHPADYAFPGSGFAAVLIMNMRNRGYDLDVLHIKDFQLTFGYPKDAYDLITDFWTNAIKEKWNESTEPLLVSPAGLFYPHGKEILKGVIQTFFPTSSIWKIPQPFYSFDFKGSEEDEREDKISLINAVANLEPWKSSKAKQIVQSLERIIRTNFETILGAPISRSEYFSQQIYRLNKRHLFQLLFYFGLSEIFKIKRARGIIVTNLDGAINGPLFEIGNQHEIPCYVIPHSKVTKEDTEGAAIVVTEYWLPLESRTLKGDVNQAIYIASNTCASEGSDTRAREGTGRHTFSRKITLVFNGMQIGLHSRTRINFVREVISELKNICKISESYLSFRLKPGDQTPILAFCNLFGLDLDNCLQTSSRSLEDVFKESSIIVSIGEPTSALWTAIEWGCAVVLIANIYHGRRTLSDNLIIKGHTKADGLKLIQRFVSNQRSLESYKHKQASLLKQRRDCRTSVDRSGSVHLNRLFPTDG